MAPRTEVATSIVEVVSVTAVVAGVWGAFGWAIAAIVGGLLGLVISWLVTS